MKGGRTLGKPKLRQSQANLLIHLLGRSPAEEAAQLGVLDVRRGRLFLPTKYRAADFDILLANEALSFIGMWHDVGRQAKEQPGAG